MLHATLREADSVIGFTDGAVDWALAKIGRPRGAADLAFPFGHDASPPPPADLAAAERFWDGLGVGSVDDGAFVACFVGSMTRRLPLGRLVEAAALVSPALRPRIRFVLCGDGDARADLVARARGLEHVLLPGWVNRAEIWSLLRRSHIGLLPYPRSIDFLRSIPNKAVEYLSGGLPIVTSMRGEMAALIARTGCGLALEEETPRALTRAVLRLAGGSAEFGRLRARAAAAFADLTADVVYGRLIDHMAALAREGGPRTRWPMPADRPKWRRTLHLPSGGLGLGEQWRWGAS
jgi:glycosyltransferase involved in cell wall biosynthesis